MSRPLLDTLQATLGKDYAIERELGGGGMARVFVAEERALGRKVVIKVLPPDTAADVSVDRFKREVQLAARLQHPHIVPLLTAGEANGILYYTMPLVEGESLRTRLGREHELPVAVAMRILRDVADALAYAHAHDVVHRDVKPDNILITGPHALVADFGIAKALATARAASAGVAEGAPSITQVGVAIGTPAYMAPEQASADPQIDHRVDVYAIGAVGYELLTGRPPFAGHSPQALLAAVISKDAEPIVQVRPSVPPTLASLVMRCLEKRPADRPQSAAEVLRELEALTTPTGNTPAERPRSRPERRWIAVTAVAAAVVAAVALFVWQRNRPSVTQSASSIVVMPFAPTSPDSALTRLGRDLVVTLTANLDGVGEIRAADPFATLGLTAGRERLASANEAADLARRLGATSFVLGTLVREAGKIRLDFALHAVESVAQPLARASVAAIPDSISALTDSATWSLLRQIWHRDQPPTPSVAAITTRSMPALRAYLEGERARADGDYPRAVAAFDRAIQADSSFWLAYRRNASTRGWVFMPPDTILNRWRSHVDELPERDQLLVAAGSTPTISGRIEAYRRLAERYPDYWEAWEAAGDLAFHEGALVGVGLDSSQAYLERVVALNPRSTESWQHLLAIVASRQGVASPRADSIVRTLDRLGYDSASLRTYGFGELRVWKLIRAVAADPAAIRSPSADTTLRQLATHKLTPALSQVFTPFALWSGAGLAQILISRRALERGVPPRDDDSHRWAIEMAWAARGAYDSALVLANARARATRAPTLVLDALRFAALAEWTGAIPDAMSARWTQDSTSLTSAPVLIRAEMFWLRGVLAASRGDSAVLRSSLAQLSRLASDSSVRHMARSLRAFEAEAAGRTAIATDSMLAVETERAERGVADFTIAFNRLALSRWLQTAGRTADAARVLLWHEGGVVNRNFLFARHTLQGWTLLERGRVAESMGRTDDARRLYSAFLRWFDQPMPNHHALVDEARTALSRLSRKGG